MKPDLPLFAADVKHGAVFTSVELAQQTARFLSRKDQVERQVKRCAEHRGYHIEEEKGA